MSRSARTKFPYSIECKNQEKVNVWESYKQSVENSKDYRSIVVIKNNHKPLVIVDADYFVRLHDENSEQLDKIEKRLDNLEKKIDHLTKTLDKHIKFIDNTYEGLRNPIDSVKKVVK